MHDDSLGEVEKVLNYSIQFCTTKTLFKKTIGRAVVVHAFNLSTHEAEVGGSLSQVRGQPGLQI